MNNQNLPGFLPAKPINYLVQTDEVPESLTHIFDEPPVLTFHSFTKLKRGDRVCIKAGEFAETFGTVKRRSRKWKGYTMRCTKARRITVSELPREPINFTVEVG